MQKFYILISSLRKLWYPPPQYRLFINLLLKNKNVIKTHKLQSKKKYSIVHHGKRNTRTTTQLWKLQHSAGRYNVNCKESLDAYCIKSFLFLFFTTFTLAINTSWRSWSNLLANIYISACRHFIASCLQSMNKARATRDKWGSIFSHRIVRWCEPVSAAKLSFSFASAMCQNKQLANLLLTRHDFPELSINSHWYNNSP